MSGVILDTDPALGLPFSDVDDAIALEFAVRAGLPVTGLTTCFGNAPLPDVDRIAREMGDRFQIPVHTGASRPGQVDTAAVDALLAHTGTVVALAPLTNIAAALLRGARWERLIVLGGTDRRLPNLRPLHTTELNLALDPVAATVALARCDVLFPMEVCRQVWFGRREVAAMPAWLGERCAHWMRLAPLLTGRPAFHPWDLLPLVWLANPSLFTLVRAHVRTRFTPLYRGRIAYRAAADGAVGGCAVAVQVDARGLLRAWRPVSAG